MKRLLVIALCFALACTTAPTTTRVLTPGMTAIRGTVADPGGSPLPGATVTAQDSHGGTRTVVTDAQGRYSFPGLASGRYVIVASLTGLGTSRRVVTIRTGDALVNVVLSPASVAEAITVTADAPLSSLNESFSGTPLAAPSAPARHNYNFKSVTEVEIPTAEEYATFADHGFVDTAKERVTTFAIDVDRASYANIRRFFSIGQMPPRDAVRIEEMLNYFTWNYPQPTGEHPFSITAEVSGCPWNANNRLLRIGIQGRNLEQWKMAPNNLVFLIDVSGSMSPPLSLPLVKQAFRVLVDQLRAEDRVAIVVYAGHEGLALPSTSGADKATILAAIDNLGAGGSTAGAAGIELAYEIARKNFLPDGNNRVILATDGDFNVGVSSTAELQTIIEKKRESGIFLSTIGVGSGNYRDALMETLADKGNGNYAYLDSLAEAEKVFKHELTGTLVTIAKDVKVQLEFDPSAVASYRQIGYENRALANEDFADDTKDAGELGAGHSVTALYEIVPKSQGRGSIATIALRYKEPKGSVSRSVASVAIDEGKSAYEASPDMQFAAAIAEMGMLLRNSPHAGASSWDEVIALARMARGADLDGTRGEFGTLVESAKVITGGADVARR